MNRARSPGPSGRLARPFGEVLREVVRDKRFHARAKYGKLVAAWEEVVGEQLAEATEIAGFEEGCLLVKVSSPVILQELSAFMERFLLEELQKREGGRDVASIEFRLGGRHD